MMSWMVREGYLGVGGAGQGWRVRVGENGVREDVAVVILASRMMDGEEASLSEKGGFAEMELQTASSFLRAAVDRQESG